jgi:hypothetical protein
VDTNHVTSQPPAQIHPPPQTKTLTTSSILIIALIVLLSLSAAGFFAYQNWQLKQRVSQTKITTPTPAPGYTCPKNGWVDCMPVLDAAKKKACSPDAMSWYKINCPDFRGGAL